MNDFKTVVFGIIFFIIVMLSLKNCDGLKNGDYSDDYSDEYYEDDNRGRGRDMPARRRR